MGCSKRRSRRVSHSNKAYLKKQEKTQAYLPSLFLFPSALLNIYLFIWLCWVLAVACGVFRCGARAPGCMELVLHDMWGLSSQTRG